MSGNPDDEHVATQQLKQVSPLNGANSGGIQPQLPQAPPSGPGAGKARLQCHACNRLLEYDAGAQYVQVRDENKRNLCKYCNVVQCFSCSTMNAVQPGTQIGGKVRTSPIFKLFKFKIVFVFSGTVNVMRYLSYNKSCTIWN